MGKKGWAKSFSKICRSKGISTPEEVLRHNIKRMKTYFDKSVMQMKSSVIQKVRNQLSKGKSVQTRGKGVARFQRNGKHRSGKCWWRCWSSLPGGLDSAGNDREANGCMTFVETYIPEGIYDTKKKHIRKRKPSDPEPKPCALLLKIMAEEFPEHEQRGTGETSIKVEGIATKTEVETVEIPDNTEIQAGHGGKVEGMGMEVKTENIPDIIWLQQSTNTVSQKKTFESQKLPKKAKGNDGPRVADGGWTSDRRKRSTDNRFDPYSDRLYGLRGSRAGYGGYGCDRKIGNTSAGQYGYTGPRTGYGGYNSDRLRGSASRGQFVYGRSRAGYGGYNSGRW